MNKTPKTNVEADRPQSEGANEPSKRIRYADKIDANGYPRKGIEFDLNLHIHRLLNKEPFFAALSRRIAKCVNKSIPTAAVTINRKTAQFELHYNPEFMGSLSDKFKLGVLKHEFYHLVFDHVTSRRPNDPKWNQVWNVATDLAINSHLRGELPVNEDPISCLMPGKGFYKDFPVELSAEQYFKSLKKLIKDQDQNGGQQQNQTTQDGETEGNPQQNSGGPNSGQNLPGQFDDHGKWEPNSDENGEGHSDNSDIDAIKDIARERLKDIIGKAAQEAASKSWGTISAQCRKDILKMLQSKVDWRTLLRYFVRTSQRAHKYSTVRRVNKRYRYIHPGRRVRRTAKLMVAVDMSGSVDNAFLALIFAELNGLAKQCEFTMVPFDTTVDEENSFVWKKGKRIAGRRTRSGGTCFNAPTEYCNKQNFDGLIILTDLYAPKPIACRVPRLWMTKPEYAANPYFQTNERIAVVE